MAVRDLTGKGTERADTTSEVEFTAIPEGGQTHHIHLMNNKVYDLITEHILALLESGVCPWRRPWHLASPLPPQNFATGRSYQGINLFLLSVSGFESPYYLTFRQVSDRGGQVRKGSRGIPVVFWSLRESDQLDTKGKPKSFPFLRYYTVFNAAQIENVPFPVPTGRGEGFQPWEAADAVVANWTGKPEIQHGFSRACYLPGLDQVHLPSRESFYSFADYYSTLFHELGHSTGAAHRLNRLVSAKFGDGAYGREELVAEMTAAFLCAHCGIDHGIAQQQAAYLDGWLKALKEDSRLIVQAASLAQKAAHLILGDWAETEEVSTTE